MPSIDATLTWALPVDAKALAIKLHTHVETVSTLNMLRLCLRFGVRPNGTKLGLPVELVKEIQQFVVAPVREELAREFEVASRCFRNACSRVDHIGRADATRPYNWYLSEANPKLLDPAQDVMGLTDDMVAEIFRRMHPQSLAPNPSGNSALHTGNRLLWASRIEGMFRRHRLMFEQRFGLDIWFSHIVSEEPGFIPRGSGNPHVTVAYLTLPRSVARREEWVDRVAGRGVKAWDTLGEHGFGMGVTVGMTPSMEMLERFPAALKDLGLEVFVHETQRGPGLRLGSSGGCGGSTESGPLNDMDIADDLDSTSDSEDDLDACDPSSFPRPTLLLRSKDKQW